MQRLRELGLLAAKYDPARAEAYRVQGINPEDVEVHFNPGAADDITQRHREVYDLVDRIVSMEEQGKQGSPEYGAALQAVLQGVGYLEQQKGRLGWRAAGDCIELGKHPLDAVLGVAPLDAPDGGKMPLPLRTNSGGNAGHAVVSLPNGIVIAVSTQFESHNTPVFLQPARTGSVGVYRDRVG